MDEINAFLEQHDKRRINDIRNIARSGLVDAGRKGVVSELLRKGRDDVQESAAAAAADPVKPSSSAAGADSEFSSALGRASSSSGPVEKPTYQFARDELSSKSLEYSQTTYQFLYQHKTKITDREKLIKKILEYKLDIGPSTKELLEQQEQIAKSIKTGKSKNTKK